MPLLKGHVHLDGVKRLELERRAGRYVSTTGSDCATLKGELDCEFADLVPEMQQLSLRPVKAWPRRQVPYTINGVFLLPEYIEIFKTIRTGIETFNRQVDCVKWVERKSEKDYVEFVYDQNSCQSYVGRIGGRQKLWVADWATTGNVLHEMGHAIGLFHEQCRLDRDRFVKVHMDRIEEGAARNFEIVTDGVPMGPYDYDSIMHYPSCAFSKEDGIATIEAPPAAAERIGQRKKFSHSDLKGIESVYGPLQCTYEQHGEQYWPQYGFECRTCWGAESDYGCCLICALSCHSGPDHLLIRRELSPDVVFACDCGRNHHQQAVCTSHSTGEKYVKQPFYHCRDCFQDPVEGCCYQCMKKCHRRHNTTYFGVVKAFCDCGLSCGRTRCTIASQIGRASCRERL